MELRANIAPNTVLLQADCDINIKADHEEYPLHLASRNGTAECLKLLAASGANVNCASGMALWTPLHLAAINNHLECLEALLSYEEIDVNAESSMKTTPLHQAASAGSFDCLRALISHPRIKLKLKLNAQDCDGDTALHKAAKHGHAPCLNALIAAGADKTLKNNSGQTSLSILLSPNNNLNNTE